MSLLSRNPSTLPLFSECLKSCLGIAQSEIVSLSFLFCYSYPNGSRTRQVCKAHVVDLLSVSEWFLVCVKTGRRSHLFPQRWNLPWGPKRTERWKESKDGDECNTERGRKASTARGLSDAYTSPEGRGERMIARSAYNKATYLIEQVKLEGKHF